MKNSINVISTLCFVTFLFACKKEPIDRQNLPLTASEIAASNPKFYSMEVKIPEAIAVGKTTTFSGTAGSDVAEIQVLTDAFDLGTVKVVKTVWSFSYNYNTAGKGRKLVFNGKDINGKIVNTKTYEIDVIDPLQVEQYVKDVPYFYQYENKKNPSGSCQNTCVAMVMKYYANKEGKKNVADAITPDAISEVWGTNKAQSVPGMEDLFNKEAASKGLNVREKGSTTLPLAEFAPLAKLDKPMIVHGYFTNYGHIMVVLGFDGTHYICNDPAGKWSQQYKNGGYNTNNNTEGIAVRYEKTAFEKAISPDGMVWVHIFN